MGTIHSISRKNCFISYSAVALKEPVQICRTPLIKDCNVQGPEICRSEQEWDWGAAPELVEFQFQIPLGSTFHKEALSLGTPFF